MASEATPSRLAERDMQADAGMDTHWPAQGSIEQASRDDAADISALRLTCYREAQEFDLLQPEAIAWNDTDDANLVLIARSSAGQLLSTTRASVMADSAEAEAAMGCSNTLDASLFPALLLGRGATTHGKGCAGLHSLLRYHFLQMAADAKLHCLLGMVYEGAPRTRLMSGIGYEFYRPRSVWDPEVRALRPVLIGVLPREKFTSALDKLAIILRGLIEQFPLKTGPVKARQPAAGRGANG